MRRVSLRGYGGGDTAGVKVDVEGRQFDTEIRARIVTKIGANNLSVVDHIELTIEYPESQYPHVPVRIVIA